MERYIQPRTELLPLQHGDALLSESLTGESYDDTVVYEGF